MLFTRGRVLVELFKSGCFFYSPCSRRCNRLIFYVHRPLLHLVFKALDKINFFPNLSNKGIFSSYFTHQSPRFSAFCVSNLGNFLVASFKSEQILFFFPFKVIDLRQIFLEFHLLCFFWYSTTLAF